MSPSPVTFATQCSLDMSARNLPLCLGTNNFITWLRQNFPCLLNRVHFEAWVDAQDRPHYGITTRELCDVIADRVGFRRVHPFDTTSVYLTALGTYIEDNPEVVAKWVLMQ